MAFWKSAELKDIAERVLNNEPEFKDYDINRFVFLESDKKKGSATKIVHADCERVKGKFKALYDVDFIITFYKPNISYFTDEQKYALMHHELLHAKYINGEPKIEPHDIEDFSHILDKYGVHWSEEGGMDGV